MGGSSPRARGDPPQSFGDARGAACGCTCSTRPTPAPCSTLESARRPRRRRCSSSPRSRAGRSRRSRTSATSSRRRGGDGRAVRRDHRPGLARSRSSPRSTASGASFENDPDIGGRYSALSYFGLVPAALMGADVEGLLDRARWPSRTAPATTSRPANSRPVAGRRAGRARAPAAATSSRSSSSEPISSFGLWVEQLDRRVHGQGGQGRSCRSPTSRSATPEVYGDDRVFVYLRDTDEPDAELDAKVEALARAGPPGAHARRRTARTTSGGSSSSPSSRSRWPAGCSGINPFDQPNVQEAKDNTGKVLEQFKRTARCPRSTTAPTTALRELLDRRRAAALRGDHGLRRSRRTRSTRRSPSCARRSATRRGCTDDVRLRPALPALDRPVPQGRAADRPLPPARPRRRARTSRSRSAGYTFGTLKNAQAIGDLQTLRAHGLPAERVRLEGDPGRGVRRTDRTNQGVDRLMQIGFVGLGQMGGNMVHRIHRDSDHEVVAFDFSRGRRRARPRRTARPARRRSRTSCRSSTRRARCGSWCRPASRRRDRRQARRAARGGRHDRRRRQLEVDRRQGARRRRSSRRASTTSTSARAAASGA